MLSLFFSYSHKDEESRNQLEVHLATLQRQNVISTWHDRRIGAGAEVDRTISQRLDSADLILLLVSPDFLASDYCHNVEMTRALKRHESGKARVIPVILQPCDWHNAPFGRLRATPRDGKPIAKYPNVNDAYLEVVQDVRDAAIEISRGRRVQAATSDAAGRSQSEPQRIAQHRSSNLRMKREFTDKERDDFLDSAYEYVARFFENSLGELQDRNPSIETRFRRIDTNHFEAAVYTHGRSTAQCRIWLSSRAGFSPGLGYSTNPSPSDSSFNEILSVVDDGLALGLRAQFRASHVLPAEDRMTFDGAAEYLWALLVSPLQ